MVLHRLWDSLLSTQCWFLSTVSPTFDGFAYLHTYETLDKKYIAIGSIEPQFYKILIDNLGLNFEDFKIQMDKFMA